jgi:hypothetical protein
MASTRDCNYPKCSAKCKIGEMCCDKCLFPFDQLLADERKLGTGPSAGPSDRKCALTYIGCTKNAQMGCLCCTADHGKLFAGIRNLEKAPRQPSKPPSRPTDKRPDSPRPPGHYETKVPNGFDQVKHAKEQKEAPKSPDVSAKLKSCKYPTCQLKVAIDKGFKNGCCRDHEKNWQNQIGIL